MPGLEDTMGSTPPAGNASQYQMFSDLQNLDIKTVWNRGISSFVLLYVYFAGDLDQMLMSAGDSDIVVSAKTTGLFMVVDQMGAMVRRAVPQLTM